MDRQPPCSDILPHTCGWDLLFSSFPPMLHLNTIKACLIWKFLEGSLNDECLLEMEGKLLAITEWSSELKLLVLTLPHQHFIYCCCYSEIGTARALGNTYVRPYPPGLQANLDSCWVLWQTSLSFHAPNIYNCVPQRWPTSKKEKLGLCPS